MALVQVCLRFSKLFRVPKCEKIGEKVGEERKGEAENKKEEKEEEIRRRKNIRHLVSLVSHQRRDGVAPPIFTKEYAEKKFTCILFQNNEYLQVFMRKLKKP